MNLLSKINGMIGILAIGVVFFHFFISNLAFSKVIFTSFLTIFFLLIGLEKIYDNKKKTGYFDIIVAFVMFSVVIKEFVSSF